MAEKDDYVEALGRQLEHWEAELDAVETGAREAVQSPRIRELLMLIAELRQQQAEMRSRVEALKHASDAGWAKLRAGADQAVDDFKNVYSKARLLWPPD
jgi:hypothetical protein